MFCEEALQIAEKREAKGYNLPYNCCNPKTHSLKQWLNISNTPFWEELPKKLNYTLFIEQ